MTFFIDFQAHVSCIHIMYVLLFSWTNVADTFDRMYKSHLLSAVSVSSIYREVSIPPYLSQSWFIYFSCGYSKRAYIKTKISYCRRRCFWVVKNYRWAFVELKTKRLKDKYVLTWSVIFLYLYMVTLAVVIASEDHSPEKGHTSFSNLLLF